MGRFVDMDTATGGLALSKNSTLKNLKRDVKKPCYENDQEL